MKFVGLVLLILLTEVLGKNVVNLNMFSENSNLVERDNDYEAKPLEKRKNKVDLNNFKAHHGNFIKREAKNVYDLNKFKALNKEYEKREAKNVYDLNLLKGHQEKRSDTSILDITTLASIFEPEFNKDEAHQIYFEIKDEDSVDNVLQSVLPLISDISIFSSYIRDNANIYDKTGSEYEVMVIFAPTNNAISNKLDDCKPWEFPYKLGENEVENEIIIQKNIDHFLNSHIISNFEEKIELNSGSIIKSVLNNGKEIKVKQNVDDNLFQLTLDGENWIDARYVKQVKNGFIFVIDDVFVNC